MICETFFHSLGLSFYFLDGMSFEAQKSVVLMTYNLSDFSFVGCGFGTISKTPLFNPR
jgi:hypothetical protein